MALPLTLQWSLRTTLRSPWALGPWLLAVGLLPLAAAWTDLSILSRQGAQGGTPGEFAFLAGMIAVLGASPSLDRMEWLLARTGRLKRVGHELLLLALPGTLVPLGVLLLGSAYWGWPSSGAVLAAAGNGLRLSLLALLLSRSGLGLGSRIALLPLLGWWLPAALAGMGGTGAYLASFLSAGAWPAPENSPFGSIGRPAPFSLAGWVALLLTCTPGLGRHAIRDPR
ncbi:MAG TPA: hypothetical protein EYQ25_08570 [Planctomycetes bacterium]|nr:hypothetical protein [Planctomycetota bacterium]HIL37270.1 hypothetical protein [Planctomycetota bacterium]